MMTFSATQLGVISKRVTEMIGLSFPEERWRELIRGITVAAAELNCTSPEAFVERLIHTPPESAEIEVLARNLTIGETYFFRENQVFSILEETIVSNLIKSRRGTDQQIRIWCAGCSSGEEPYSVAILLHRLIPDIEDWRITIHATDINPDVLKKASQGVYTEWSFRDTGSWLKRGYFTEVGKGRYEVIPEIRRLVTFSRYNLVHPTTNNPLHVADSIDIILCRNVLMYFSASLVRNVVSHFYDLLNRDGWLILSVTETLPYLFPQFEGVSFPQAMLYQKKVGDSQQGRYSPAIPPATVPQALRSARLMSRPCPLLPVKEQRLGLAWPNSEPEKQATLRNEAFTLFTRQRYGEAIKLGKNVIEEAPEDSETLALLSRCSANQGDLAEAKEWCEQAIQARRTEPAYHYLMSSILQGLGEEGEAIRSLQRVLYLDQNSVLAHYDLGNLALRRADAGEAIRHFSITERILSTRGEDEEIPDSGGLNTATLAGIIRTTMERMGKRA